jgi:parallel beta-helix repeat protein
MLTISMLLTFDIKSVKGNGTVYIRADGSVEGTDKIISDDNVTYTFVDNLNATIVVERDNIIIDGEGFTLQGGISLYDRRNVTVQYMEIEGGMLPTLDGIELANSSWCSILNNHLKSGITVYGPSNKNSIENNVLNEAAIIILSSHNTFVHNNTVIDYRGSLGGIAIYDYSSDNMVINNTVINSGGIQVVSSWNNTLIGNKALNSYGGIGIAWSYDNYLSNNVMTNNTWNFGVGSGPPANWDVKHFDNTVDLSNIADGKPIYYIKNASDVVYDSSTVAATFYLINCSNVVVKDHVITNTSMVLCGVKNALVENITLPSPIVIYGSETPTGLLCIECSNVTLNNNVIGHSVTNWRFGINLVNCHNNEVVNNLVLNNWYGITLWSSSNNVIRLNKISRNYYGVAAVFGSSNNAAFHNNLLYNVNQTLMDAYNTTWDAGYPSGGNYWTDYNNGDLYSGRYQNETGSDGVGDTPYIIDANNQDRYPRMAPFKAFEAGVWNGSAYNVDVISNSTISDFNFDIDNKCVSFNVSGDDGTIGFCRVAIPKSLLWADGGWTIFVDDQPVTDYTRFQDENFTYLYFTYNHSTHTVIIQGTNVIPELPSTLTLIMFTLTTLIATTFWKTKRKHQPP